jgi:ribosomal protein S18 acetylase RimI-like enzyme
MLEGLTFQFADESTKETLSKKILSWITSDYISQIIELGGTPPVNHFFYIRETIAKSLQKTNTLVASNAQGLVGYLIWELSFNGHHIDIQFIEVHHKYRLQGVARDMINALSARLTDAYILSAFAENNATASAFFQQMGWHNKRNIYFKIIRPVLEPSNNLPDSGLFIGICPFNYYKIRYQLPLYSSKMRYFPLELRPDGMLSVPIVSPCEARDYVATYFNGQLIESDTVRGMFITPMNPACNGLVLFMMVEFNPSKPELYEKLGISTKKTEKVESTQNANAPAGRGIGFFRERDKEGLEEQPTRLQPGAQ